LVYLIIIIIIVIIIINPQSLTEV